MLPRWRARSTWELHPRESNPASVRPTSTCPPAARLYGPSSPARVSSGARMAECVNTSRPRQCLQLRVQLPLNSIWPPHSTPLHCTALHHELHVHPPPDAPSAPPLRGCSTLAHMRGHPAYLRRISHPVRAPYTPLSYSPAPNPCPGPSAFALTHWAHPIKALLPSTSQPLDGYLRFRPGLS